MEKKVFMACAKCGYTSSRADKVISRLSHERENIIVLGKEEQKIRTLPKTKAECPKAAFDIYECTSPTKLRLSVSNLLKLLKRTRSDESVEIVYDDANKKLNITLKNKIVRKFITPTLEPSTEEVPTPKVPFNARVRITAVSLRDIIDDAQSISDNVKLEVSPEKFTVRATGELSSAIIEMEKGSDAILELDAKEACRATYNLNYFGEIIRAGSGASEVASLEFSTNMPIKVEFEMPQQGRLLYYLAPKIEQE